MGWYGEIKEFKNIKKKKEIIESLTDNTRLTFVELEQGIVTFQVDDPKTNSDNNPNWWGEPTYMLRFQVNFYPDIIIRSTYCNDKTSPKYYWKDVKDYLIKDYNQMRLWRITWRR